MESKNPILKFRKKHLPNSDSITLKNNDSKNIECSTMITKTRESIDMTEHS